MARKKVGSMFKINDVIQQKASKDLYKITDIFSTEFMQILTAEKEGYIFYFTNFDDIELYNKEVKSGCLHEWKNYTGIVEIYNFCTKCDKKDHEIRP